MQGVEGAVVGYAGGHHPAAAGRDGGQVGQGGVQHGVGPVQLVQRAGRAQSGAAAMHLQTCPI